MIDFFQISVSWQSKKIHYMLFKKIRFKNILYFSVITGSSSSIKSHCIFVLSLDFSTEKGVILFHALVCWQSKISESPFCYVSSQHSNFNICVMWGLSCSRSVSTGSFKLWKVLDDNNKFFPCIGTLTSMKVTKKAIQFDFSRFWNSKFSITTHLIFSVLVFFENCSFLEGVPFTEAAFCCFCILISDRCCCCYWFVLIFKLNFYHNLRLLLSYHSRNRNVCHCSKMVAMRKFALVSCFKTSIVP